MSKKSSKKLILIKTIIAMFLLAFMTIVFGIVFYLKLLPKIVSDEKIANYVSNIVKETTDADLVIEKPFLRADKSFNIVFKTNKVKLSKEKKKILDIEKINAEFSIAQILKKKIILKKVGADYIYLDADAFSKLFPQKEEKKSQFDWTIDWLDSTLYMKKIFLTYTYERNTKIKISGKNLEITASRKPKRVHFDINIELQQNNNKLQLAFADKNSVYIQNKKLYFKDFLLKINKSVVAITAQMDEQNHDVTFSSKKFDIENIVNFLNLNILIPNGKETLAYFKNIKGAVDFKINLSNNKIHGTITPNKIFFGLIPVNDLPICLTEGKIIITPTKINVQKIKGFYGKNSKNKLKIDGTVEDYTKSVKTNLAIRALVTNELTQNYLSKMLGTTVELTDKTFSSIKIHSIYNKIDIDWFFKIKLGRDILFEGMSLTPKNYDRALKGQLHFENNILNIKSINYYIAKTIKRKSFPEPVIKLSGALDFNKGGKINNLDLEIPQKIPSEFFNLFLGLGFFKRGTVVGNINYINTGKYPILEGTVEIEKLRVPSQRLFVKKANLTTTTDRIDIKAEGRYRRSKYRANGSIKNAMVFPIIVKNVDLTVDTLDVDRILKTFNNQTQETVDKKEVKAAVIDDENMDDETYTFDTKLLVVERCIFNVVKGVYQRINFGDLHANLTLNDKGIFEVKSNKFNFAEGISSCKVYCDLKKHKYSIRLGAKDVDSDAIASSILKLDKEISGKASALMEFYSDDSLKLNGSIKFIIKDGTIEKLGLVEYILKVAALFRNPIVMISPSIFMDIANVPEGAFDSIIGILDIKDNIIYKIQIKSTSPQLSSLVAGRYDLEKKDASLRIYTKFSGTKKGFTGFLRNISLNSLARKVSLHDNETINYYAAEIKEIPQLQDATAEENSQIFVTKVEGDVENNNFISSLKKLK